jgi:molybdate transport system substrate-binding protein
MKSFTAAVLVGSLVLIQGASAQSARTLRIAAASDLQAALPEILKGFERETRASVSVSFGSSGNFFAQIQNGAPYDVYLSADIDYPRQLIASTHADAASLYRYATGRLVLWTRNESGIDVTRGLSILKDARVKRIAVANAKLAPYGRAAEAALRREKLYDVVHDKLVRGDNISQTAQLVDSGNADVGIIALSLALSPALRASGHYFEIPEWAHPPIEQAAVVVAAAKNKDLAHQLLAYLKRPEVARMLHQFGFMTK